MKKEADNIISILSNKVLDILLIMTILYLYVVLGTGCRLVEAGQWDGGWVRR